MSIKSKLDKLRSEVVEGIISGKYKLIEIGEHTSTFEYKGEKINVWTANGETHCTVYGDLFGVKFHEPSKEQMSLMYKAATKITPAYLRRQLKDVNTRRRILREETKKLNLEAREIRDLLNLS